MAKKQLLILYVCYLIPYIVGNAFLPFLPIYAQELGASHSITGYYLAIAFGALAIGTISSGWISERFQRRKIFIILGFIASFIGSILMGLSDNIPLLTLSTAGLWFCGGITTGMILILTGILAPVDQRGRTFGFLTTAMPLGAVVGGAYAGQVIELWDYSGLFITSSFLYLIPLVFLLGLEDPRIETDKASKKKKRSPSRIGSIFWIVFVGTILVYSASFASNMTLPLIMLDLNFDAVAIASPGIVSGIFTLPLPFLVGWLSDRIGRKWLLIVTFLATGVGLIIQIYAGLLWHFWLSRVFMGLLGSGFALGSALLTDVSKPEEIDTALSRFASTPWIGGVLGYTLTGVALEQLGMINVLWIASIISGVAGLLIVRIQTAN
jgi:MFS family permease